MTGPNPTLRVGITPPRDLFSLPHAEQRALLAAAADAGLDHLFTADHVSFRGGSGVDGIVHLAALSGLEPRLGLYLGVHLLALRHPLVAARQLAELASVAPGRLTYGVGVGGEDRHEFEVCGIDPATRGRRTDAALEIVQRLLAGEQVDWNDEFFRFEEGLIRPTPMPSIPVIVGGRSDVALKRAAWFSEGWLAAWCSARRLAEGMAFVEHEAAALGRTAPDGEPIAWQHGIQLWVGIGDDPAQGRMHVAEGMKNFYRMPFEPFERYTPVGSAADIAEFMAPYVAAGASVLNLTPVGNDRATEIETIGEVKRLLLA